MLQIPLSDTHSAGADQLPGRRGAAPPKRMRCFKHRDEGALRNQIVASIPNLRGFAVALAGNVDHADDLVQDTLLRALANIQSFEPGTNLHAWLFTILRNQFRSNYRKRCREVEDADGRFAERLVACPEQNTRIEFNELRQALAQVPADQREALILVAASGLSYQEAAEVCGCALGTVKSRVHRARAQLAGLLSIEGTDPFGPDQETRAVMASDNR